MITFNVDPESTKAIAGVAKRFADVVYCIAVIFTLAFAVAAFGVDNEAESLFVGSLFSYAVGWTFRFIVTGNNKVLFQSAIVKLSKLIRGKND